MFVVHARGMTASSASSVPTGIRAIRQLAGPPDAPWPGRLVHVAPGVSRLLVDASLFDPSSPLWRADAEGHVLAACDVVRRTDGHDVLVPLCTQTLDRLLARRAERAPLTDGERLTVAVSVLRGLTELAALGCPDARGQWWVTDDARPIFAAGCGGETAIAASVRLLGALATGSPRLQPLLERGADLAADPPHLAREIDTLEARLFQIAQPEPLATAVLAPPRHPVTARRAPSPAPSSDERGSVWTSLARHVDVDLADLVSRITTGIWRRARRPATNRRRGPWIAAAAAATAVLVGAVFVPAAGGAADARPAQTPDAVAETVHTADDVAADPGVGSAEPTDADAAPDPSSREQTVTALLDARRACAGDAACLVTVQEDPALAVPAGAVDLEPTTRRTAFIDDFGDVAVVRVDGGDGTAAQLVVIAAHDGKWLLRDVYDVAQQP